MVDLNSLISVASTYADLIGVALIAAGVFLGLIRRALGFLIVGVGIVATLFVATIEQQQGQTELFVWLILGGGVVASVLLALAVRTVLIAAQLLVFLAAWFLLLFGLYGFPWLSGGQGSATWLALSLASTFVSGRFHRGVLAKSPSTAGPLPRAAAAAPLLGEGLPQLSFRQHARLGIIAKPAPRELRSKVSALRRSRLSTNTNHVQSAKDQRLSERWTRSFQAA